MISIEYDKLEEVSRELNKLYDMLQYHLEGTKRDLRGICFTPLQMFKCPQIWELDDDMVDLQQKGNGILDDIQE